MRLWMICNYFKWILNLKQLLKQTEKLLARNKTKDKKVYKVMAVSVLVGYDKHNKRRIKQNSFSRYIMNF
jgi:hypothetical protein